MEHNLGAHLNQCIAIPFPSADPSVTHENLMSVLKDVKDWSSDTHGFPWCIDIPTSERKRIENMHKHSDSFQLKSAFIEHWLKTFPYPCWERICYALYWQHEYDVLEKVQAKYFVGMCILDSIC